MQQPLLSFPLSWTPPLRTGGATTINIPGVPSREDHVVVIHEQVGQLFQLFVFVWTLINRREKGNRADFATACSTFLFVLDPLEVLFSMRGLNKNSKGIMYLLWRSSPLGSKRSFFSGQQDSACSAGIRVSSHPRIGTLWFRSCFLLEVAENTEVSVGSYRPNGWDT